MNSVPLPQLRIVVLAAGYSRRLGSSKALARVHGSSLLRRTALLLAPLVDSKLLVIVPPRARRFCTELRRIPSTLLANVQRSEGLASSVRLGLRHTRFCAGVLFVPVDFALLERRDLRRLIARWRAARRRVAARRIGTGRTGARGAAPVILPKHLFAAAARCAGDAGLRDLIASLPPDERVLVELPSAGFDVVTREDLEQARRRRSASSAFERAQALGFCTSR
ncbi:MAG TPA: NTP transferase domain-containing protein [Steroidobacteraceae bacterium]|nr:NTP transferase domain-containing protein [Steroidobacteraceae bacterium]